MFEDGGLACSYVRLFGRWLWFEDARCWLNKWCRVVSQSAPALFCILLEDFIVISGKNVLHCLADDLSEECF